MTHWANSYIGKPWRNGGVGPDAFDCHGITREAYRVAAGIILPVVDVDAMMPLSVRRAMRDYDYSPWEEIDLPSRDLDVVEMSLARRPHHVGVYLSIDGGGVLTSVEGCGVIFQSLVSLKRHGWNIVQAYRRKACE